MKVVGVIPSRLGAVRFPKKPLADIAGKPMIVRVWEQAKKSKRLQEVIVATDSEEIAHVLKSVQAYVVLTDPNLPSGTDRIGAAMKNKDADIVINIQGDEPALDPDTIDKMITCMIENSDVAIATPAVKFFDEQILYNPASVKVVVSSNGDALYFSRSPIPYPRNTIENEKPIGWLHLGLYGYKREALEWFCKQTPSELEKREGLEQLRFLENNWKIRIVPTDKISIGVDTPEDVERVIQILKERNII